MPTQEYNPDAERPYVIASQGTFSNTTTNALLTAESLNGGSIGMEHGVNLYSGNSPMAFTTPSNTSAVLYAILLPSSISINVFVTSSLVSTADFAL